jgi:hypothetical protein
MSIKKYNEFKTNMIQPKIQTVYLPTSDNTDLVVGTIDKYDYYKSFQKERNVEEVQLITFTPEEFEQFKREFGGKLLEKAADNVDVDIDEFGNITGYDDKMKKSILNTLDDYLLNNKL